MAVKKGNASKNKGNTWERELCKYLGSVFGGSFVRSNNSGAYIGGKNNTRKEHLAESQVRNFKGDIIPPDELPLLVIEAKFYKELAFHQLVAGKDCLLLDTWIAQTYDCVDENDHWFIIFKINLRGSYVCYPKEYGYPVNNYVMYKDHIITSMPDFIENNKEKIRDNCAK